MWKEIEFKIQKLTPSNLSHKTIDYFTPKTIGWNNRLEKGGGHNYLYTQHPAGGITPQCVN